ncbi:lichenicidin A2 family type 2 lantibiotic [Lactococcus formosensis]|jgi:type 2 lantibiotic (TIGR03893 family)|uniref:Lichenicidin A2 family type 2 lantibiotic n=1 Tax=Lactococcus formosensis TaxID=1281486 RepID=A0A9X4PE54_9LACT|nr:lichenicidin A2 family type 2 lantibiotic [Lactococcus formosensis]MCO7181465.1 lichenicidin A2 family type 2 lantibiotic [Lactococcus formosensis]MDG6112459.1 lichenicidin A2 family type 2 lantibiotic [Lactococcus formosensis]MDG6118724.1 lichenicidin A2 family type 2 lantibiotic [Lactococcus formosensis]MDG6139612.1 lichenicidin A2 family type 2 lantibiotic [Lactococcus formosensis]MDG6143838.1 lichenicidin A2 family type 2 lantibiotic [Lactococcus formosensis]
MSEINTNKIVGDAFEELTIAEMTQVQGTGDVEVRSTPICTFTAGVTVSIVIVKTLKGRC